MHATFTCKSCKNTVIIKYSIKDPPAEKLQCLDCGSDMNRVWSTSIHIPMDFADDLTTTISHRMQHAPRPTGRNKALY